MNFLKYPGSDNCLRRLGAMGSDYSWGWGFFLELRKMFYSGTWQWLHSSGNRLRTIVLCILIGSIF